MYPRVPLEAGENVLFQAPAFVGQSGTHVFVTNNRVIVAPIRFVRRAQIIRLDDITSVDSGSKGFGWPLPKQQVRLKFGDRRLTLRPWASSPFTGKLLATFMGLTTEEEFVAGVVTALAQGGVTVAKGTR